MNDDSGFSGEKLHRSGKENNGSSPRKRPGARKSLASNWLPSGADMSLAASTSLQKQHHDNSNNLTNPETPSKSLLGSDNSLLFSPPSILKETLKGGRGGASSSGGTPEEASPAAPDARAAGAGDADGGGHQQHQQQAGTAAAQGSSGNGATGSPPKSKVSNQYLYPYYQGDPSYYQPSQYYRYPPFY